MKIKVFDAISGWLVKHMPCKSRYISTLIYEVGSKSFWPDIQKPRQMENAVKDI